MKLRTILNEIGSRVTPPPRASYMINQSDGKVAFDTDGIGYIVNISIPAAMLGKIMLVVSFETHGGNYDMTNLNKPLQVMSYVVGAIKEFVSKYNKKYGSHSLVYIQYSPKSEENEKWSRDNLNRRDKMYRIFIEKFAQEYGSSTSFSVSGGNIVARFDPPIVIN